MCLHGTTAPATRTEGTAGTRTSGLKGILSRTTFPPERQAPAQPYTCSQSGELGRQGTWFRGTWQVGPRPPPPGTPSQLPVCPRWSCQKSGTRGAGTRCGLAVLGLIGPGRQPPSPHARLSTLEAASNGKGDCTGGHVLPIAGEPPLPRVNALMQSHADPQNSQGQGWEGRRHLRSAHPTRRLSASLALQHKKPWLPLLGAAIIGFYRQGN